jgi:DNA-binding SARP family transcriptional activator
MLPDIDRPLVPRADASELKGDPQLVLDNIQSAISDARGKEPAQLISVLLESAEKLALAGNYHQANLHADEALQLNPSQTQKIEAQLLAAICASQLGNLLYAEELFQNTAELCRQVADRKGLANALNGLAASVLLARGKFNLALAFMDEAHAIFTELGENHWGWPWLRTYVYLTTGNRPSARHILYEMVKEIEPATRIAGAYYYLWARLAIDEEEFEQAREYLRLGLRIATQTNVPDLNIWLRLEHSRFYRGTGKISIAREWADEALRLSRLSQLTYFSGLAQVELAQVLWLHHDQMNAFQELAGAIESFKILRADYDLAVAYFLRAIWCQNIDSPEASQAWNEAARAILAGGYAFILEKEQEQAFYLTTYWMRSGNSANHDITERLLEQLAQVPPQALKIATLGQFSVWKGRGLIQEKAWQRRRAGELFRFLLLQPNRTASKDAIIDALWAEHDIDSGSNLLHQATSALRRLLEPDLPDKFPSRYLAYDGEQISLKLPPGSVVDFEVFLQNLRSAIQVRRAEYIQDALHMYSGVLLPLDQYCDWTTELRTHLAELHIEGLVVLARIHLEQERFADALECVHQVSRLDSWNEEAVLIGMQTYLRLGSAPHALRLYNQLAQTLSKDLQLSPRPDLRELAQNILNR